MPFRFLILALAMSAGCAIEGPDGPEVVEPPTFTDAELTTMRAGFVPVPAAAPVDPTNQYAERPAAIAFGHKLFFDPRYSATGTVSCATCHDPATGFQDARSNTSMGVAGMTGRHAPSVYSVAYGTDATGTNWNFWDGRKDSQWAQALGPPENAVEMGGTRTKIAYLIYDHYRSEYEATFGAMPALRDGNGVAAFSVDAMPGTAAWDAMAGGDQTAITRIYVNFGKSIAAYERQIVARDGRFDQFVDEIQDGAADSDALTAQEKAGLKVFVGKGACLDCHHGPTLSDWKFHCIGVSELGPNLPTEDAGRSPAIAKVIGDEFNCASPWSDMTNKAACAVNTLAGKVADFGSFRTPGLRNLTQTAPYMHTGTIATLEAVVEHYDAGSAPSGYVGIAETSSLDLTTAEKAALVDFMRGLDGEPLPAALVTAPTLP
jgi:cytochrome c peroxidase